MATSREQVIMALATDLKVWPKDWSAYPPDFDGWRWSDRAVSGFVLVSVITEQPESIESIDRTQWEAEIKRLSSPTPAIKWKEGDVCTAGTIAYVSTKHHNVMVRGTHVIRELDGRSLKRKLTKDKFIAQQLALYVGDMSQIEAFEKIIVDAEIDWEDG